MNDEVVNTPKRESADEQGGHFAKDTLFSGAWYRRDDLHEVSRRGRRWDLATGAAGELLEGASE